MKTRTKLGALIATAVLAVGLAGCASQYTPVGTGVDIIETKTPGGGTVLCAVATGGGVDCDWDGASR